MRAFKMTTAQAGGFMAPFTRELERQLARSLKELDWSLPIKCIAENDRNSVLHPFT